MGRPAHRLTPQRSAILQAVQESANHPTAAQIYSLVKQAHPRIAFGTVYKALHLLSETGQILQLDFADDASRYDRNTKRHDHAICTACGALADVEMELPEAFDLQASRTSGFLIHQHNTQFHGLCPKCQSTTAPIDHIP